MSEDQIFTKKEENNDYHFYEDSEDEATDKLIKSSSTNFEGFSLMIQDLITWVPKNKKTKKEEKFILKGITTSIQKGTMTAVVGPSGSGKTTFLNFLSGRQDESQMFRNYCHYYINDTEIEDVTQFKNIIGFVPQDDVMEDRMTPTELFKFYYDLRWNEGDNYSERQEQCKVKVQEMIDLLGLQQCANTIVGNTDIRGISGGEKKRVNVGMELIRNPNLLFLDEPTTGLDSTNAYNVMESLEKLKKKGITIVSTLHQPSQKILQMFDKILILVDGKMVYDGDPKHMADRIKEFNFKIPKGQPPLEHFLEIIDKGSVRVEMENEIGDKYPTDVKGIENFEKEVDEKYQKRIEAFYEREAELTKEKYSKENLDKQISHHGNKLRKLQKLATQKNQQRSFFYQLGKLISKNCRLYIRFPHEWFLNVAIHVFICIIIVLVFLHMGTIEEDPFNAYRNRSGYLLFIQTHTTFAPIGIAARMIIPQKRIYIRDRQSRLYRNTVFFLATFLYIIPFYIFLVWGEITVLFFINDVNNDSWARYLWFLGFYLIGGFLYGEIVGLICSVVSKSINEVSNILPIFILPPFLLAGFFTQVKDMWWPVKIFSYTSVLRFAYQGAILNEFTNRQEYLDACTDQDVSNCDPFSFYDFYETSLWLNMTLLCSLNAIFFFGGYFLFIYNFREKKARMVYEKRIVDEYAIINKDPLKM